MLLADNTKDPEAQKYLNSEYLRYDIINYLIDKNKFEDYLEIGVFNGDNIRKVKAKRKDGVDPGHEGVIAAEVNYPMISDDFFNLIKDHKDRKYDIIFIDGLHQFNQVDKDILNSLRHLKSNGYIVLHDCNPISFESQKVPRETVVWNGDVWRSIINLRLHREDLEVRVVDTDMGVGIVNRGKSQKYSNEQALNWEYFSKNREELLNLITVEDFKKTY